MVVQGQSLDLWTRVVPREGMRNPCIRACILALGALDCARDEAVRGIAGSDDDGGAAGGLVMPLCSSASPAQLSPHRTRAMWYYVQALAHMRLLLAGGAAADSGGSETGGTARSGTWGQAHQA
ncbi:hypothetical protein Micbo1qcDRAFT_168308, partial [Microdochium bolleyi]